MTYITPNDPNFNEIGEGACEEALFLVKADEGQRAIVDVHLFDSDEESPSGYAWDFTVYKWDGAAWLEWDGGRYWDYASADAMLDFDLPAGFENERIKLVDLKNRFSPVIDSLLAPPRMFSEIEWSRASDVGDAPEPRCYSLSQTGIDSLLSDYAGTEIGFRLEELVADFTEEIIDWTEESLDYIVSDDEVPSDGKVRGLDEAMMLLNRPGLGLPTDVIALIDDFDGNVRDVLADDPWFDTEPGTGKVFRIQE